MRGTKADIALFVFLLVIPAQRRTPGFCRPGVEANRREQSPGRLNASLGGALALVGVLGDDRRPGGRGGLNGGGSTSSAITTWVEQNFTSITIGGVTLYDLTS